jgi:predicted transcriptional regulator of viral defense system
MKYYEKLVDLGCFSKDDVEAMTGNRETAHSIIESYKKKGLIESVRRNLFVAISLETKQPVPSRYAIASNISSGAYISHHSAFEYHGLANQVYYEIYVAAQTRFREFEYDGITYSYVLSPFNSGIEEKKDGVRVTDLERTVVDGINDYDRVGGLEELLRCIGAIPFLDSEKLVAYLLNYDKEILYQKAGYILEHFKTELKLTDIIFDTCLSKVPQKSKRYLFPKIKNEPRVFSKNWSLYVPVDLMALIRKGAFINDRI